MPEICVHHRVTEALCSGRRTSLARPGSASESEPGGDSLLDADEFDAASSTSAIAAAVPLAAPSRLFTAARIGRKSQTQKREPVVIPPP